MEEGKRSSNGKSLGAEEPGAGAGAGASTGAGEEARSFGKKCGHLAKTQRAKFYILRRCIAMLVCWRDRNDQ
ncbi:hypothetical protein DCAR_0625517 [Daucus carota subsp. sativus]|uniref:Uncharacterized protein n=2 Tax=Daucus carota subsp. sativus TaxID=79200 RepID=A0A161ZXH3_DAUCS|nr:hypothetical protein DCAR_0625517 [Daucus carota subsp. sativus]